MMTLKFICLIFLINLNFSNIECAETFILNDGNDEIEYSYYEEDEFELSSNTSKQQTTDNNIRSDFDKFKNELTKSAELILDKIANDTKKYKNVRDSAINGDKKRLENEKRPILKNLYSLQEKKKKIENIISKIQEGVKDEYIDGFEQIKEQCRIKLKILNDRKSSMKNSDDDDFWMDEEDDMFRDEPDSQYELNELNKEIKEVENNLANLKYGKHGKLSFAYSQLVDVYKDEQLELKKKMKLESTNKIESISDIYAKNIESIYSNVKNKVQYLINDAFDFIKLSKLYDWIVIDNQGEDLPKNAILGGLDSDRTPLYVIRRYVNGSFKYGKYAFSSSRKNAYLTNDMHEFGIRNSFELLTASNFFWCDSNLNKGDHEMFPICRAHHENSTIPGTLLKNNTCRVGFGSRNHIFSNEFEVISFNPCNVPTTTTSNPYVDDNYEDFDLLF